MGAAAGGTADSGKIFGDGYELLRLDDRLHDVCVANSGAFCLCHHQCFSGVSGIPATFAQQEVNVLTSADPGDWGGPAAEWRPVVAASARHGLVDAEVAPPRGAPEDILSSATSESSHKVCPSRPKSHTTAQKRLTR